MRTTSPAETVKYHLLPSLLLNEMQRQQRTIEAQQRTIQALEREAAVQRGRYDDDVKLLREQPARLEAAVAAIR